MSRKTFNCQGVSRRDFIQLGLGGTLGLGLADGLRLQAASKAPSSQANDTRCILVWLDGGPSHYETFDPKPNAPQDIREISAPFLPPFQECILVKPFPTLPR